MHLTAEPWIKIEGNLKVNNGTHDQGIRTLSPSTGMVELAFEFEM